jgi:hypothetical protein
MSKTEFLILCAEHSVSPEIALENENLIEALRKGDRQEVYRIIMHDF